MRDVPERLIVRRWQSLSKADLVTEKGEPIRIVYPGRINNAQGADLLDAVINTSQGLCRGDIEVHAKSSNWRAHHHHLNPAYNHVILHVVLRRDTDAITELQNRGKVPVLALNKHLDNQPAVTESVSAATNLPCHQVGARRAPQKIAGILDRAGEERFRNKASEFGVRLTGGETDQVLYEGMMGALGYAQNKLPFLELARRLPLKSLMTRVKDRTTSEERLAQLQAILLGTAGLLPSQRFPDRRKDDWSEKLDKIWAAFPQQQVMSSDVWHWQVRPNNCPTRRLAAMSYLILRYEEGGIVGTFISKVKEVPVDSAHQELERMLLVIARDYWARHTDFGSPVAASPTLLGRERAADIAVNVILPFSYACGPAEVTKKALEIYRRYPRLSANELERHMLNQLGLDRKLINSAQRQQGLLHLYKTKCSQGNCQRCPFATTSAS